MIALAGTIRVGAGLRAAALPHIAAMVAGSRGEPGCRAYRMAFDVADDHLLHIFELFDDEAALAAHRASAHMAAWRARYAELGLHDRAMAEYVVSRHRAI